MSEITITKRNSRKIEACKLSPARNVCLNLLMRYEGISYQDALNKVQNDSLDALLESHNARAKVRALKQAVEEILFSEGGAFDDDYFYNKCGEEVYEYFEDFLTFELDPDLMFRFTLGIDDDEGDEPLIIALMRKYHDIYLSNAVQEFDINNIETAEEISIMPAPWLMKQLPFEFMSNRELEDLAMVVDCFANRSGESIGTMDDESFTFCLDADIRKAYLELQAEYYNNNDLSSHDCLMKYVENIAKTYPLLQKGNENYQKTLQQVIELDNGFDQPVFEVASFLDDILENNTSQLEYYRVHGAFR